MSAPQSTTERAVPKTTKTLPKPFLLSLPPELREMIFSYLLPSASEPWTVHCNRFHPRFCARLSPWWVCRAFYAELPPLGSFLRKGAIIPVLAVDFRGDGMLKGQEDGWSIGEGLMRMASVLRIVPGEDESVEDEVVEESRMERVRRRVKTVAVEGSMRGRFRRWVVEIMALMKNGGGKARKKADGMPSKQVQDERGKKGAAREDSSSISDGTGWVSWKRGWTQGRWATAMFYAFCNGTGNARNNIENDKTKTGKVIQVQGEPPSRCSGCKNCDCPFLFPLTFLFILSEGVNVMERLDSVQLLDENNAQITDRILDLRQDLASMHRIFRSFPLDDTQSIYKPWKTKYQRICAGYDGGSRKGLFVNWIVDTTRKPDGDAEGSKKRKGKRWSRSSEQEVEEDTSCDVWCDVNDLGQDHQGAKKVTEEADANVEFGAMREPWSDTVDARRYNVWKGSHGEEVLPDGVAEFMFEWKACERNELVHAHVETTLVV